MLIESQIEGITREFGLFRGKFLLLENPHKISHERCSLQCSCFFPFLIPFNYSTSLILVIVQFLIFHFEVFLTCNKRRKEHKIFIYADDNDDVMFMTHKSIRKQLHFVCSRLWYDKDILMSTALGFHWDFLVWVVYRVMLELKKRHLWTKR